MSLPAPALPGHSVTEVHPVAWETAPVEADFSPVGDEPSRESLALVLGRLKFDAHHAADLHYRLATRWRSYQVIGGILAALLATSAGVTSMTETVHPTLVGVKAIAAAAISAAMMLLEPSQRAEEARSAYARYLALCHRAHRVRHLDLPAQPAGDIRKVVEELSDLHNALATEAAPIPPHRLDRTRSPG